MNTCLFVEKVLFVLLLLLLDGCVPSLPPNAPKVHSPGVEATSAPVNQQTEPPILTAPTPNLSAAPGPLDKNQQQAALLQYILDELSGTEKQHLLVAYIKANPADSRGKLNLAEDNILRAWVYQDGSLHDSTPTYFAQRYAQEPNGPWSYAYMAFSLNQVSPDFTTATVHVDRIPGLAGGKGQLFELVRQGEKWSVMSQRTTWIQ